MGMMDSAYSKQFWTLHESIWPEFRYKIIQNHGAAFAIELTDEDDGNFWTRGELVTPYSSGLYGQRAVYKAAYSKSSYAVKECLRDIGIRHLPEGIRIEKISTIDRGRKIRKVHMSVSKECSSYIFNTRYADVGIPFCNLLLSKHENLLQDIYTTIRTHDFFVLSDKIHFASDGPLSFDVEKIIDTTSYWAGSNHRPVYRPLGCFGLSYSFEEHEMQPLKSVGQQYGMALAYIEICKKNHPEMKYHSEIAEDICGRLYVRLSEIAEAAPPANPKELKEW